MVVTRKQRRSLWMYGLESEEPTDEQRREYADKLAERLGISIDLPPRPRVEALDLREPRIQPPDSIAEFCFSDSYERALHAHNNLLMAFRGEFPNPPDVVAHPRNE